MSGVDPDDLDEAPDPLLVLGLAVLVYGALVVAALVWLWCRERTGAIAELSIGRFGPLAASGAGLAIGVAFAAAYGWARSVLRADSELHANVERMFTQWDERVGIAFAILAAFAEELFFRLAVQDALGLSGSVTVYVLLNLRLVGVRWMAFTFAHAVALGGLVELGGGLLGSTSAHAVFNYLSLRRIHRSS